MYKNRNLSDKERAALLEERKANGLPWHTPPHFIKKDKLFLINAACYEHAHHIGRSTDRMENFSRALLEFMEKSCEKYYVWVVLPNHYHFLAHIHNLDEFSQHIQAFHSVTAINWNREDDSPGRQVFHSYTDRFMRNERHYWTTFNYLHNNPVKHKYVEKWTDWPWSSVHYYLEKYGREKMKEIWFEYPVKNYGKGWDD